MYDPCIPEALKMFDDMTTRHKRELLSAELNWELISYGPGDGEKQLVPILVMDFKF